MYDFIKSLGSHSFSVDDGLVVLKSGQPGLLLLNATARGIWERLFAGLDASVIARQIATEYNAPLDLVARDVQEVIANWETVLTSASANNSEAMEQLGACMARGNAQEFVYNVYNRSFCFRIFDPDLAEEVTSRFAPHTSANQGRTADYVYELTRDENGYIVRSSSLNERSEEVSQARIGLIQDIISVCLPDRRFIAALHAGAASQGGRCLLFSARTGGGKSTLMAALGASGYTILNDDLIFLDFDHLEISTFPLSIMLRQGSWDVLNPLLPQLRNIPLSMRFGEPVRFLQPELTAAPESIAASALILLEFNANSRMELVPVSAFDALVQLNETNSWLDTEPSSVKRFLTWIQNVPRWKLRYSNLKNAIQQLQSIP